jgi:A/G-specific adenine glycosylase
MSDAVSPFSRQERARLRRRLQAWFKTNRRDLPWRRNRDPYAIWVSEVMLQQTQIATVIPFYLRFMERFPSVAALAAASEQEVLRQWEGLGYYRRARHLHRAAQVIVRDHAGMFPGEVTAASALPGLGRYTVGAVLSQAYGQRLPVVDANVARVLTRLGAWQLDLEKCETQNWLWQTAETLLPRSGAGDFNQALMELGQTVCVPQQPSCLLCPLRDVCRGRAQGVADRLPNRSQKLQTVEAFEVATVIEKGRRLLLAQRKPDAVRWANMWEFPTTPIESPRDAVAQASKQVTRLTGVTIQQPILFGTLRHGVTRFRITLQAVTARYGGGSLHRDHYQNLHWVEAERLADYPLSVPQRRLAALWKESRKSARP